VSEKEISIILLVANLATSIVCRQNTKVTRLFLAIGLLHFFLLKN
jgi:hypothetical protein